MRLWEKFTKEEIFLLAEQSLNQTDFCRKMGYKSISQRAIAQIKEKYPDFIIPSFKSNSMAKDLTGQTFGRWTVLKRDWTKKNNTYYICQCSCKKQTIKSIPAMNLTRGKSKSCGCLRGEMQAQRIKENKGLALQPWNYENLIGQTFSELTVISKDKERSAKEHKSYWNCKCSCGEYTKVSIPTDKLKSGHTQSCGHLHGNKASHGQLKIQALLQEKGVSFKQEYSFKDLVGDKNGILRFDFAIFEKEQLKCLIEYQGEQHYKSIDYFGGEKSFKQQKEYDKKKVEYCKEKNIPLYFITYNEYNKITFDFLKERMNLNV